MARGYGYTYHHIPSSKQFRYFFSRAKSRYCRGIYLFGESVGSLVNIWNEKKARILIYFDPRFGFEHGPIAEWGDHWCGAQEPHVLSRKAESQKQTVDFEVATVFSRFFEVGIDRCFPQNKSIKRGDACQWILANASFRSAGMSVWGSPVRDHKKSFSSLSFCFLKVNITCSLQVAWKLLSHFLVPFGSSIRQYGHTSH